MQKVFIAVLAISAILGVCFYLKTSHKEEVHHHAAFQIYIDGKLQDYTDIKYMSLVPCTDDEHQVKTEDSVHLHDNIGDVVHVHKQGAVWNDLFKYIKLNTDSGKEITGYVNGKEMSDIMNEPINAYDSLVLLVGSHGDVKSYLDKALKKEYIEDVETKSGLCPG